MKRVALFLLLLFLNIAHTAEPAAGTPSPKTITVRVLTYDGVRKATITPMGTGNWRRTCASCSPESVSSPFRVEVSGGQLRLEHAATTKQLELHGSFRLKPDSVEYAPTTIGNWRIRSTGSSMQVLLTVPLERYVMAVLSGEAAPDEPYESLKAMAVAIRTFALVNIRRHATEGFSLCDTTHCQVSRFIKFRPEVERAVQETSGETLWANSQLAEVTFTGHCGGTTEDANNVWNSSHHFSYLVSHADAYCIRRSTAEWHSQMTLQQLASVGKREGWHLPAHISAIEVTRRSPTGRAMTVLFRGEDDTHTSLQAVAFRYAVDRALGLYQIRSDWYTLTLEDGVISFVGKGYGHGVGLCQAGSFQMAVEGRSYKDILSFYFPTTEIHSGPKGSSSTEFDDIVEPMPTAPSTQKSTVVGDDGVWQKAKTLFPADVASRPTIHIAATGDDFQEATGEASWSPGFTRGKDIYLQVSSVYPDASTREDILLRQYILSLIDQNATAKTPPWLRLGLAEALAGPTQRTDVSGLTPVELDAMLAHPSDRGAWEKAHATSGIFVQGLIKKYGQAKVRGWLKAGTPASINDFFFSSSEKISNMKFSTREAKPATTDAPRSTKSTTSKKTAAAETKPSKEASTKPSKDDERPTKTKEKSDSKSGKDSKSSPKESKTAKQQADDKKDDKKAGPTSSKKSKSSSSKTPKEDKESKAAAESKSKKETKSEDKDTKNSKHSKSVKNKKSSKDKDKD